ncbi:MAG: lamin tail domain-containing protein [Porphyromonadaceae bacterium]|nr:lamin tail domain-containing protein [Porphyromonadaceae bacterium]
MKEIAQYTIRWIAIGLYLLHSSPLSAQIWQANLEVDGRPSTSIWRHDTDAFEIAEGWLSLSSPRTRGRKILTTNILLGERMRWQGVVRLDQPPSAQNYAYVLLCCYEQDQATRQYDYLALSIGGGARRSVALVSLRIHWRAGEAQGNRLNLTSEQPLLDTGEIPEALYQGLRYDVRYSPEGILEFRLLRHETGRVLYREQTEWQMKPLRSNSFGVVCVYTATRHRGMHFRDLRLDDRWSEQEETPEDDTRPPTTAEQPPMLSEVMANPHVGAPEYIELYNPNAAPIPLEGYRLGVGKSHRQLKFVSLANLAELPAHSYTALSVSPEDLLRYYPSAPADRVKKISLPRLSNTGCLIALYRAEELVDEVLYTPDLFDRGLKSKKGVALERVVVSDRRQARWRSALASSSYATPAAPNSLRDGYQEQDNESQGEQKSLIDLLRLADQESKWQLSLYLYTPTGTMLWRADGRVARQWGKRLAHNLGDLHELPTSPQGQLILVAQLSERNGRVREQIAQSIILMPH